MPCPYAAAVAARLLVHRLLEHAVDASVGRIGGVERLFGTVIGIFRSGLGAGGGIAVGLDVGAQLIHFIIVGAAANG